MNFQNRRGENMIERFRQDVFPLDVQVKEPLTDGIASFGLGSIFNEEYSKKSFKVSIGRLNQGL